jgi:hypothetical protein
MTAPARRLLISVVPLVGVLVCGCGGAASGPVSTVVSTVTVSTDGAASKNASTDTFRNGGFCRADTLRDSGRALDIRTVCVASTSNGTIEFRARTTRPITNKDELMFSIDADLNRHTGSTAGFDYWLGRVHGHIVALDTKRQELLNLPSLHGFVRNNDLILILNRRDLGNTTGFRFYAWSQRGHIYGDDAPNGAALLRYKLLRG